MPLFERTELSPDFLPKEHFWDYLGKRVSHCLQKNNVRELEHALQWEWNDIPLNTIHRLIGSMILHPFLFVVIINHPSIAIHNKNIYCSGLLFEIQPFLSGAFYNVVQCVYMVHASRSNCLCILRQNDLHMGK